MVLDRRIIQALYVDPRAPFSRLAEVLGSSEQTVSRRYRRLFDGRILRVVGQLDSQRLGQYDWAVRIRCAPGTAPAVAAKLAAASGHLLGAADLGGNRDLQHDSLPRTRTAHSTAAQPALGRTTGRRPRGLLPPPPVRHRIVGPAWPERPQPRGDRPTPPPAPTGCRPTARRPSCRTPTGPSSKRSPKTAARPIGSWRRAPTGTSRPSDGESRNSSPPGSSSSTWTSLSTRLGSTLRLCCGCPWSPQSCARSGEALAGRPEMPFVAATTGSTNLVAALALCGRPLALRVPHRRNGRPRRAGPHRNCPGHAWSSCTPR